MALRTEEEIQEMIDTLEERDRPDEDCYLDEGEQATLMTLYWVLGNGTS